MDNIALYIRISVDDDIGNNESFSIVNQRLFLNDFLKKEMTEKYNVTEYIDDGYTGTNFQRPQFRKMLYDINIGLINCIIVKDFSRFARNYVDITDYLCNYFPLNQVRFISVNDSFDSKFDDPTQMNVSFKNLMYDYYSKDISQKVRSSVYELMKKGNFIGSKPLYGYKIDNTGKIRKLIVDEESSKAVKRIFTMLADGFTPIEIATQFNKEKIMTPSQYRIYKGYQKSDKTVKSFWDTNAVRGIANNVQYTGKLVNAKTMTKEIGATNAKSLPKENHIVTENAHEAIVSEEIFLVAQKCIKNNYKKFYKTSGHKQYKHSMSRQLFLKKVKCAYCGYVMYYNDTPKNPKYYCKNGKVGYLEECNHLVVLEKEIENFIASQLNQYIKVMVNRNKVKSIQIEKQKKENELKKYKLTKLKKSLNGLKKIQVMNYENFLDEKITRKMYEEKQNELESEIKAVNCQIEDISSFCQTTSKPLTESGNTIINSFINKNENITLTREIIDELVKEVLIYSQDCFEVVWKFEDFIK